MLTENKMTRISIDGMRKNGMLGCGHPTAADSLRVPAARGREGKSLLGRRKK